eukprot:jgi/Chlat1/8899/Chrsp92S08207
MAGEYKPLRIKQYPASSARETAEGKFWRSFKAPVSHNQEKPVTHIDFSPVEPHHFAVTSSSRVRIFDASTREVRRTIARFHDIAYSGSFRGDGQLLVAGGETGDVSVFDVASRDVLRRLKGHNRPVHLTRYGSDKVHILSGSDDSTVRWWDVPAQSMVLRMTGHTDYVRSGAAHPTNADVWATGSYDHTAKLWDLRSAKAVLELPHGQPVEDVAFFPSGGLLVSAGGNYLSIWDVVGGKLLRRVSHHQKTITQVHIAPNTASSVLERAAPRMLSASLDGHVKVTPRVSCPHRLTHSSYPQVTHAMRYSAPILSMGLSPDSTLLAVGMADGMLSVRKRPPPRSIATLPKESAGRVAPRPARSMRQGAYRYFMRGATEKAAEDDFKVLKRRKAHLAQHDHLLKAFRYGDALNAALRTGRVEVVMTVFEELCARGGLRGAISGRDNTGLLLLLSFLCKHVTKPRYARLLIGVSHLVLDIYTPIAGSQGSEDVDAKLLLLAERIKLEVKLQHALQALQGMLQPVLTASFTPSILAA